MTGYFFHFPSSAFFANLTNDCSSVAMKPRKYSTPDKHLIVTEVKRLHVEWIRVKHLFLGKLKL